MSALNARRWERITKLLNKARLSTKSLDPMTSSTKENQHHPSEPQSPKATQTKFVDRSAEFKDEFVSLEEAFDKPKVVYQNSKEKHYMKKEKAEKQAVRFEGLGSHQRMNERKAQSKTDYIKIANGLLAEVEKSSDMNSTHNIFGYGDCVGKNGEVDLYEISDWFLAERMLKEVKNKINEFGQHVDGLFVPKNYE